MFVGLLNVVGGVDVEEIANFGEDEDVEVPRSRFSTGESLDGERDRAERRYVDDSDDGCTVVVVGNVEK